MDISPYLNFNGKADEAIEFYKKALGAKVNMLMRFKDSPEPAPDGMSPNVGDKVMHADLTIGKSALLVSDGRCSGATEFKGINLSLKTDSDAETTKFFNALAEGGKITMPLAKTFFSSAFGMLTDRFGVNWMIITMH